MRTRLIFRLLTVAAIMAVGVIWFRERAAATTLQERAASLARQEQRLARLQAERGRLRHEVEEARRRVLVEPVAAVSAPAPGPVAPPVPPAWAKGEWTPAAAWRNAGRATPQATTTTLLWAAANGDLATLRDVFQFDERTRARARAWFDSLPPGVRSLYATPEDLVAGVTLAHIALDSVQINWLHQGTDDRAIVGMLMAGPVTASAPPLPGADAALGNLPPTLDNRSPHKVVVLNLQRAPDGWRVQVPAVAIDNMARNLRAQPAK